MNTLIITKKAFFVHVLVLTIALCLAAAGTVTCHAETTWTINGVTLPLDESGYREGDYMGGGKCWQFASHIYYRIWNRLFYQDAGTDDDMLRNYPHGEARRITAENTKLFISFSPIGSVIRVQSVENGPDKTASSSRHSMILLDKTDDNFTVYHLWSGVASITTYTWAEFEQQLRIDTDFGYFKYIKYPGAEPLDFVYSGDLMDKELVISSRLYGATEITESKR